MKRLLEVCLLSLCVAAMAEKKAVFDEFFAWGAPLNEQDAIHAAECGVTHASVSAGAVKRAAVFAKKYNYKIYPIIVPGEALWKKHRPDIPAPVQEFDARETALHQRFASKEHGVAARREHGTRFGGEPDVMDGKTVPEYDVIAYRILCLNRPETMQVCRDEVRMLAKSPDVSGIALDFFGYQNLRSCECAVCRKDCADYLAAHPGKKAEDFYLMVLMRCYRELTTYIHGIRPGFKVFAHLYPAFKPKPLFGHETDIDFCGETVAWYFLWPPDKIREYTREVVRSPRGVPFVGYYNRSAGEFPVKDAQRFGDELDAILAGGGRSVMICSAHHVFRDPELRKILKERMKK